MPECNRCNKIKGVVMDASFVDGKWENACVACIAAAHRKYETEHALPHNDIRHHSSPMSIDPVRGA